MVKKWCNNLNYDFPLSAKQKSVKKNGMKSASDMKRATSHTDEIRSTKLVDLNSFIQAVTIMRINNVTNTRPIIINIKSIRVATWERLNFIKKFLSLFRFD